MTTQTPDELAASILDAEPYYDAEAWIEIEFALAPALLDEAALFGVDGREHALARMRSLEASIAEDGPLHEESDLARGNLAMAAALVHSGRVC